MLDKLLHLLQYSFGREVVFTIHKHRHVKNDRQFLIIVSTSSILLLQSKQTITERFRQKQYALFSIVYCFQANNINLFNSFSFWLYRKFLPPMIVLATFSTMNV